jgi:hypothetical protein
MNLADKARAFGDKIARASGKQVGNVLCEAMEGFIGWPFQVSAGRVVDNGGVTSPHFSSIVHTRPGKSPANELMQNDHVAAVVDVIEDMDVASFRAAYERISEAKRLQKSPPPTVGSTPVATVTMGIIFAQRTNATLETLAEETQKLNATRPNKEWPDMIAVSSVGVIAYGVQFPGESGVGGMYPADDKFSETFIPPWYVIVTMTPSRQNTFNKMLAYVVGYSAIFSPGASVPNFQLLLEGVSQASITLVGYQYNLAGELVPVPREFYNDRYLPPLPMRIEDRQGNLLSTLQFLPWQDGGVLLLRGKLPLEGLMVFLGKDALRKAGTIRPPGKASQLSYVLPISREDVGDMLVRLSKQSNMVVRRTEPKLTIQKAFEEGSSSPFMARMYLGLTKLRDIAFNDRAKIQEFDVVYDQALSALLSARTTAKEIHAMWDEHVQQVASGQIARFQGSNIHIDVDLNRQLRKHVESFLYTAARSMKEGMQNLGKKLNKNIGFMFKQQPAFEKGISDLQTEDPLLASYLQQARTWSQSLINARNDMDHNGWVLPRITYKVENGLIQAAQPMIGNQSVTEFADFMLDRLSCFVEEFTAYCLQERMPSGMTIAELPLGERIKEVPERFRLTLEVGGLPEWLLQHHASSFENT